MSKSKSDFSVKFFRPPQRTVSFHGSLLDTRTKRTIAQDRLLVAEQRILDVEQRKSATNLQSLTFEQKQLEKKLLSLHGLDQSSRTRQRSVSDANLHRINSWNDSSQMNYSKLLNSTQNLLSIPNTHDYQRTISTYSSTDILETAALASDADSGEEENPKIHQLPTVAIIPPEEDTDYPVP